MRKNVLIRTNIFICTVIILGFLLTSVISYYSNNGMLKRDVEHISKLTSEGIYHQIDSIFAKPINISLTMANDNLLKTFLTEEETRKNDEAFLKTMKDYLLAYKEQYNYDSVFLVSTKTNRYYHFQTGVDRVLKKGDPENEWYYNFLDDSKDHALNIDNDEARSADNGITIFINCKIHSRNGEVMGIVGVGFSVDTLQKIFRKYEQSFNLRAYLVDTDGNIEISTTKTGFIKNDLFDDCGYEEYKTGILSERQKTQSFWYSSKGEKGFLVTKYVPDLKWHLIIENDTTAMQNSLNRQFLMGIAVVIIVIGAVLIIITNIIRKYNAQIVNLTVEKEKAHRKAFQTETEKMYENIYEIDITHNRAASEETESYFESLGVPKNTPYDEALEVIAKEQIKEEFRKGYLDTFSVKNVLKTYEDGQESLRYDFMITNDGGYTYYWMRITARIFFWKDDQSVRMMVYRQNIDSEKSREMEMAERMQRDSLSGLYNKAATQELIRRLLAEAQGNTYAFFILDIDNFKKVNDTYGHVVGDQVIADFAQKIKQQFRKEDVVGRIGGDEFVVFVPASSAELVEKKAKNLTQVLQYPFTDGDVYCQISTSIGVAVAPEAGTDFETLYKNADQALYRTKEKGKKGYTIY
ncbi:sensor domain-containing diguanylate cyclase [Anaerovorax odorimutans]|uniref:Sensor domain-containing diguanylate cyclase n=1 Tax=Anaerovorax odorimutans TaxID=109327 RepID=A0ABT1RPY7_9FIRM|nr:sensor domain-containing diguanylate cyclase [Anaerovorax odorimutans]MCQ4637265.1 sensor domain-containing diguanylate cyclase [Anaerovorax odorimutans]